MSASPVAASDPSAVPGRRLARLDRSLLFDVGLGLTAMVVAIALNLFR